MASVVKRKTPCKYGSKCYRKNPKHLEEFSHDDADKDEESDAGPPKKKTKVDEFFQGKNDSSQDTTSSAGDQSNAQPVAGSSKNLTEKADHEVSSDSTDERASASDSEPDDPRQSIKSKFLVDMPEDFYELWEFAKSLSRKQPSEAFASTLGLHLVGPYDVLAGKTAQSKRRHKRPNYLRHWRYYYDPPELLTVVRGDSKTQFHMGYYRDDPKQSPSFVASNSATKDCVLKPLGENIFAAINAFIEDKKKKSSDNSIVELQTKLKSWAKKLGLPLETTTPKMKARQKKAVCKCFHGVGVVVPVDKNGIGYRPIPESQASLKAMLKKIVDSSPGKERDVNFDALMELVMLVQFANDECDYGEGLELGLNLFCYGGEVFHKTVLNLLPLAYQFLGREEYAKIIEAHLEDRKQSALLSELD